MKRKSGDFVGFVPKKGPFGSRGGAKNRKSFKTGGFGFESVDASDPINADFWSDDLPPRFFLLSRRNQRRSDRGQKLAEMPPPRLRGGWNVESASGRTRTSSEASAVWGI